jgi:hypothetical protein
LNANIGILNEDFTAVSSYLDGEKLTLTKFADINALTTSLNNGEVGYIILPKNMYLDMILEMNYSIVNTLNDLSLKYVLTLNKDNGRLNDIVKKYYKAWINNYLTEDYNSELFNLYTAIKKVDDKSNTDFKSKRYIYGYVDSLPYEINLNGELGGLSNEFLNSFSSFSGVEFSYKRFKTVTDLNNALQEGTVDVALNYYNLNTAKSYRSVDLIYSDYVILTDDNNLVVDTIKSLPGTKLYTLGSTRLANYIEKNGRFTIESVDKVSSLEGKNLILLDYNTYTYYRETYFKNYTVAYKNTAVENYGYLINKAETNTLFYNIFLYLY